MKLDENIIRAEALSKIYKTDSLQVVALMELNLTINRGEFTVIAGPSGSGKSTLLNLISGIDFPSTGKVYLGGKLIGSMSGNELSDFRRDNIGFIFQSYNLIPVLSVSENIEYVMILKGVEASERKKRVEKILEDVGLPGMEKRKPFELSGGQRQRVAVARAMVSGPEVILADEPTANLDSQTGAGLVDLMRQLNEKNKMTFLFSTHDSKIMERAKRLIVLKDGKIESDEVKD